MTPSPSSPEVGGRWGRVTEMRAVVDLLVAVGMLHLARARGPPGGLSLRQAAVAFRGEIPCPKWDCECAFGRVGCCCVGGRLSEVEELIFSRLSDMWQSITQLDRSIQETIGGRRVAFTASGIPSMHCFGPFTSDKSIPYSSVSLNHGDGYNPALGIFTAPCSGVYSFSLTTYSRVAAARDVYYLLQLMRNGEAMASAWEENRADSEDSSTHTILFSLETGGQVYVLLRSGRQLCGDTSGLNSFSGYLVHPIES
ncbi:unnamed protein product [Merluccius merluccius]